MHLLALLACGGSAEPEPTPNDSRTFAFSDGGSFRYDDLSEVEISCMRKHCDPSDSLGAMAACRTQSCPVRFEVFEVLPISVRYAEGTLTAEVQLAYEPVRYGDVEGSRQGEVYLGVTVVKENGEEIDLAVQTLFPARLSDSFLFSAPVGPGVQDLLIGAWDEKIEPCEVDRYGCREFGFVLDGPLASWPPGYYFTGKRQRIPPSKLTVAAPPSLPADRKKQLLGALEPFGTAVEWTSTLDGAGVRYRHGHDWWLARTLAGEREVTHAPGLSVDLAIAAP